MSIPNATGVEVWSAIGAPTGSDFVTATLAGTPNNAVIAVSRYSGINVNDPIGNVIAANTLGVDGACSGGSDSNSYNVMLTGVADGSIVYSAVGLRDKTHSEGAGYTERAEINHGSTAGAKAGMAVQDQEISSSSGPVDVPVDGSFNNIVDWGVIGIELKAAGSGGPTQFTLTTNTVGNGSVTLNPAGGVYDDGTVVTVTANPDAGNQFDNWSGDLSVASNPETITMDGNKTITANFSATSGSGDVTFEEVQTGSSSGSSSVTSASVIAENDHLYLAAVSTKGYNEVASVTGLGLTWTQVASQCGGRNATGVDVWSAIGSPTASGSVTATLTGSPNNAVIAVSRYSGVTVSSPIGNSISANTLGIGGACSGGTDSNSYDVTLTNIGDGSVVYSAAALRNKTHTEGVGYTERIEAHNGTGGAVAGLATQDKGVISPSGPTDVTVNGSFSGSVDWGLIAIEIK